MPDTSSSHDDLFDLDEAERREVTRRTALRAAVVHEAVRKEGEDELRRPSSALAWSGLAAGLSMGFSLVTEGLFQSALPDAPWRHLIVMLGYPIGFVIVVLGRQQLFTENTLTVILPLLTRRDLETLFRVLRLWAVVLAANLLGALLMATALSRTNVFEQPVREAFLQLGTAAFAGSWTTIALRGVFAGWMIALMVWLLPAASSRMAVVLAITYVVGIAKLSHVIAGSVEVLYVVTSGDLAWHQYVLGYLLPTLLGNTIGGVSLVAAVNHAQVVSGAGRT